MNNKGQIIITELLLYIIVLTIILSLIIFTMVTLNDNQVTRINNRQLNNLMENTFETLTKTSGTPDNWENIENNNIKTVGLKSTNSYLISYDKLIKLKNNPELLDNFFPTGVSYELTAYPRNNLSNKMLIAGTSFSNKKQIISKNEVILFDYGYIITSFDKDNNNECPYNHNSNWTCKAFTITENLLNDGEYHIITNDNTEYILSNTFSENVTDTNKGIKSIDNQLKTLIKNENQTIYLHINNKNNKSYMAYDKNNRPEFLKHILKPEVFIINMKIGI